MTSPITGPMRVGRHLGETEGLTTVYLEAPGDDYLEDKPVGMFDSPGLAKAVCVAVNGWHGFTPRAARTVRGE